MAKRNDRYVIYELMGKIVEFVEKSRKVRGCVKSVMRDIFEDTIVMGIGDKKYSFAEPELIFKKRDEVVFVYGDLNAGELSDDELFSEARALGYSGETMDDLLKKTEKNGASKFIFKIVGDCTPVEDKTGDSNVKGKKPKKKAKARTKKKVTKKKARKK